MELLRGMTLKQYMARAGGKGLSPGEVISFSQQAAAALAAAHAKGHHPSRHQAGKSLCVGG